MNLKPLLIGAVAAFALMSPALAEEVTLRVHQFLPAQSTVPARGIVPWAEKVMAESGGRIRIELYPSMQLGGAPQTLFSQAEDGVVDLIWTVLGYTPGRFPKSEVFELPFLVTNGADTSAAFFTYVMANSVEEFDSVKIIALHTHGPGILHTKDPVTRLEDLKGMKIRGGSRIISDMLARLGAEPVGMPVPQVTEALSKGVIEGATVPWQVTPSLKLAELVHNHTGFSGPNGLYSQTFGFVMNKQSYERLPDDLKAIIDANSGLELSRSFGRIMDEDDALGIRIAEDLGNTIIVLDEAETARWRTAAQPTIDTWIADMKAAGNDGAALYAAAKAAVAAETE